PQDAHITQRPPSGSCGGFASVGHRSGAGARRPVPGSGRRSARRQAGQAARRPASSSLLLLLLRGLLVLLTIQLAVLIGVGRREAQALDMLISLLADHAVAVLVHCLERRGLVLADHGRREPKGQERSSDSCFHSVLLHEWSSERS